MFIDKSYFVNELYIPNGNLVGGPVAEELDSFIQKYELQFLRYCLGFELHTALKAGLLEVPIKQRWIDLISGVDYFDQGNRGYTWKGLAPAADIVSTLTPKTVLFVKVGGGGQFDPAPGVVTTIPDFLVGKSFTIEQRGLGTLNPQTEYSVSGNQLTLLNSVFSLDNTYVYRSDSFDYNSIPGTAKLSPIAMYVYFWFMQNHYTQTAAMGEVKTANENSVVANPSAKMSRAWNEMSEWLQEMVFFINTKRLIYPEWNSQRIYQMLSYFSTTNDFGI